MSRLKLESACMLIDTVLIKVKKIYSHRFNVQNRNLKISLYLDRLKIEWFNLQSRSSQIKNLKNKRKKMEKSLLHSCKNSR